MTSKSLKSPNDSLQQSTMYPSTTITSRSGDRGSLDTSSFGLGRKLLSSGATIGGGSYKSYLLDHMVRMHGDIEATTRKLELEQRRLYKLDKELESAEHEYGEKRQKYKLYQSAQDDEVHRKSQDKRVLEMRLEKAILDLNKGTCENEQLREQIDQLRKERQILDTVFKQLVIGIKDKGKTIEKTRQNVNETRTSLEESKKKHQAVTKMLELERRKFKDECQKLKEEVKKETEVQKEQEKLTRSGGGGGSHGSRTRKKGGYMVADEEEAFSEQHMHRRILKLSFLNTIQRRHIKQHRKNIEVFEQAFATIKSTTGISDIEEIVKIFVGLEQRNFSLLTYVNQLNREIEAIEIRNQELKQQRDRYFEDESDSKKRKDASLKEIVQQIDKTREATVEKDGMIKDATAALSDCRPIILSIVKFLKKEIPALVNQGYEGDVPPMKAPAPDEHEENLNSFLMYIEEALMQFRVCLSQETLRKQDLPHPKTPSYAAAGMKKPSELPSAHIAGDDSDDDPETGLGERPLLRAELRERAQAMINRRRKKGQTGKVTHESRQDAGGGLAEGAAPTGTGERRDIPPPPPREYAASSASKESKDDSGPSAASLSKSPSMQPAEGDRDEMWWRGAGKEKNRK